ncbi:hypothetical protein RR48_05946 [Papilio machaon]|uniref:Uncharacterized protein n=1 Tax=Papilio machaon TaxID=76193 RepID=A0A0N1PHH4_PAPMA|nr:hypothetical protein RR48_05946 [Papilio machaon]
MVSGRLSCQNKWLLQAAAALLCSALLCSSTLLNHYVCCVLVIALMRYGTECRQGAAAGLHADPPVFRQIIIDKYPTAGQYVRLLL